MKTLTKTFRMISGAAAPIALGAAALGVCATLSPAPVLAAPASSNAAKLDQAVKALRAITTLKADFIQRDRNGGQVKGTLTLKRPGRIRFEYEKSVPMLIVGDGKALTMIDYEVNQVQRWPIKNSPLGALLDPSRDVAKYGTVRDTGNPDVISVEVRDSEHPEYGIITLIFTRKASAPGGLELAYWVALDAQNTRTTIQLSNQRYGVAVGEDAFRWKDPRPRRRTH
ncbi:MAG: outer membrane lipoprotein carrier protein LolA [Pseudomonadota bacterium]|uniref:LolA family protein n=1 Tax=Novosphingobium sp. MBES04 TaxID=1206458 RepID=UPI000580611B|nr:outer membrane lipoprotein carrier protein LolA [Novosphingobium sp. MBES04]MED5544063.1 outer membrane lipoprotein carrier protein LolA [Pseudomonadota bacterium]GAM05607.1 outer membrane lipoprotein-sorting protein [Novosphingobium sp. MBES04]